MFLQSENRIVLVLSLFCKIFHTAFHDFDISKRDVLVNLSGQEISLEVLSWFVSLWSAEVAGKAWMQDEKVICRSFSWQNGSLVHAFVTVDEGTETLCVV